MALSEPKPRLRSNQPPGWYEIKSYEEYSKW